MIRLLALLPLLLALGCATTPVRGDFYSSDAVTRAEPTPEDTGSGGGFATFEPLRLTIFGQSEPLSPTSPSFGGSLYAGAISAKSITLSAASGGAVKVPQGTGVCFDTSCNAQIQRGSTALSFFNTGGTEVLDLINTGEARVTGSLSVSSSVTKGTKVLAAGTGTVTVLSGAQCVCTNTSSATVCKASVSSTTATFTSGAGTDTVAYICL